MSNIPKLINKEMINKQQLLRVSKIFTKLKKLKLILNFSGYHWPVPVQCTLPCSPLTSRPAISTSPAVSIFVIIVTTIVVVVAIITFNFHYRAATWTSLAVSITVIYVINFVIINPTNFPAVFFANFSWNKVCWVGQLTTPSLLLHVFFHMSHCPSTYSVLEFENLLGANQKLSLTENFIDQ